MRIKKFNASNYADALEQVKSELGDDANINVEEKGVVVASRNIGCCGIVVLCI